MNLALTETPKTGFLATRPILLYSKTNWINPRLLKMSPGKCSPGLSMVAKPLGSGVGTLGTYILFGAQCLTKSKSQDEVVGHKTM